MTHRNQIPIAGDTAHPGVDASIQRAKTMIAMRPRIARAARAAAPPHRRRPAKGKGQWPGRMEPGRLGL